MNKGWVEWVANSYQTYWQRAGSLDSPFQTIFGVWFPCLFLLDGCSSYDLTSYIKDGAPEDATILCPRSNSDWHQMVLRPWLHQPPLRPTPGTIKPRAALLKQEGVGTKKYTPSLSLYVQAPVRIAKNSFNLQPCPSNQIPLWVQDSAVQYCGWDLSDSQGSHRDCVGHASSIPHVIIAFYDPCKVTSYSWSTSLQLIFTKNLKNLKMQ